LELNMWEILGKAGYGHSCTLLQPVNDCI